MVDTFLRQCETNFYVPFRIAFENAEWLPGGWSVCILWAIEGVDG